VAEWSANKLYISEEELAKSDFAWVILFALGLGVPMGRALPAVK
jgi:hypothetical protein